MEIRRLLAIGGRVEVEVYARPMFPGSARRGPVDREAAFAEQLFADAVRVLEAVWEAAPETTEASLKVWTHPVHAPDVELQLLSTSATAAQAKHLLQRQGGAWQLSPLERLRRLPTRARIDRRGEFHEEKDL